MKYKVGDKVRVRKDLIPGNKYGNVLYVSNMDKFKDEECTITNMDDIAYQINNCGYWWTDEMLELDENNIMEVNNMDRLGIYQHIISNLEDTYKRKNSDYGNSVGDTYEKFGDISFLTRITDKYNRILSLADKGECGEVKDEALEDTILDLANYCLLWLVEREYVGQQKEVKPTKDVQLKTPNLVSNYPRINTEIMNAVQDRLAKMDEDDFKIVLNMLEAYNIPYELRPNGRDGNKVKLVLVVDDVVMLQKIMNNLGI